MHVWLCECVFFETASVARVVVRGDAFRSLIQAEKSKGRHRGRQTAGCEISARWAYQGVII